MMEAPSTKKNTIIKMMLKISPHLQQLDTFLGNATHSLRREE